MLNEEAIKYAGLFYDVVKSALFTHSKGLSIDESGIVSDSSQVRVPNFFATMRTDNNAVLGVVGKDYQIVQNRDAFSVL